MNIFVCFLSGIATLLGYFFCFLKIKKEKLITLTLAFAASVMFFMSILELFPEGIDILYSRLKPLYALIYSIFFIMIGILIAYFLGKLVKNEDNLYRIGIYTAIGLIIHNFLEGFITFLTLKINTKIGLKMAFSIALHNIPEGISVAIPLFYSNNKKIFKNMFFLASSEFFGAIIAAILFQNVNVKIVGELYLIIGGIMSYIAIFELFKESLKYDYKKLNFLAIVAGLVIVIILKII